MKKQELSQRNTGMIPFPSDCSIGGIWDMDDFIYGSNLIPTDADGLPQISFGAPGYSFALTSGNGFTGNALNYTCTSSSNPYINTHIQVVAGKRYRISFKYRNSSNCWLGILASPYPVVYTIPRNMDNAALLSLDFTAAVSGSLYFQHSSQAVGEGIDLDEMNLQEVLLPDKSGLGNHLEVYGGIPERYYLGSLRGWRNCSFEGMRNKVSKQDFSNATLLNMYSQLNLPQVGQCVGVNPYLNNGGYSRGRFSITESDNIYYPYKLGFSLTSGVVTSSLLKENKPNVSYILSKNKNWLFKYRSVNNSETKSSGVLSESDAIVPTDLIFQINRSYWGSNSLLSIDNPYFFTMFTLTAMPEQVMETISKRLLYLATHIGVWKADTGDTDGSTTILNTSNYVGIKDLKDGLWSNLTGTTKVSNATDWRYYDSTNKLIYAPLPQTIPLTDYITSADIDGSNIYVGTDKQFLQYSEDSGLRLGNKAVIGGVTSLSANGSIYAYGNSTQLVQFTLAYPSTGKTLAYTREKQANGSYNHTWYKDGAKVGDTLNNTNLFHINKDVPLPFVEEGGKLVFQPIDWVIDEMLIDGVVYNREQIRSMHYADTLTDNVNKKQLIGGILGFSSDNIYSDTTTTTTTIRYEEAQTAV